AALPAIRYRVRTVGRRGESGAGAAHCRPHHVGRAGSRWPAEPGAAGLVPGRWQASQPNAGRCEAATAGALGIRLGGRNVYGGRAEDRPVLGGGRMPGAGDIGRAVRLSRAVWTTTAVVVAAARLAGSAIQELNSVGSSP